MRFCQSRTGQDPPAWKMGQPIRLAVIESSPLKTRRLKYVPCHSTGWVPPSLSLAGNQESLRDAGNGEAERLQPRAQENSNGAAAGSGSQTSEEDDAENKSDRAEAEALEAPASSALPGLLSAYSSDSDDQGGGTGSDADASDSRPKFESFF